LSFPVTKLPPLMRGAPKLEGAVIDENDIPKAKPPKKPAEKP